MRGGAMAPINISTIVKPKIDDDPTLLLHPNIPKGASGLNPRTVLGKEWWDTERKAAELVNNYCCHACGTHKSNTREAWLEGHEVYDIDYVNCRMRYVKTVSLCSSCHAFIHSGLLVVRMQNGSISETRYVDVIKHGIAVLKQVDMHPLVQQVLHMWLAWQRMVTTSNKKALHKVLLHLPITLWIRALTKALLHELPEEEDVKWALDIEDKTFYAP
jgi:hypothetical protein